MNLNRKMEMADKAIRSIAEHDDESAPNVMAALTALKKRIDQYAEQSIARRKAKSKKI